MGRVVIARRRSAHGSAAGEIGALYGLFGSSSGAVSIGPAPASIAMVTEASTPDDADATGPIDSASAEVATPNAHTEPDERDSCGSAVARSCGRTGALLLATGAEPGVGTERMAETAGVCGEAEFGRDVGAAANVASGGPSSWA